MFKFKFFLLVSFIISISSLNAQIFEGKVTMSIYDAKSQELKDVEYYTNGKESAILAEEEGMKVSIMMKDNKMLMVMHAQKLFMEIPLDGENKAKDSAKNIDDAVVNTGETKMINGLNCTKYIIKSGDLENGIAWFTKDLGGFFLFKLDQGKESQGTVMGALGQFADLFPVLVLDKKDGKEVKMLETTKAEVMPVPSSIFEVPKDYKSLIDQMMQQK